jgi:hypothetical protein
MAKLPTFPHVLAQLQPIVPALYRSIEGALQKTREFFETEGAQVDRSLAPNLVRYYTKSFLAAEGQGTSYEEDTDANDDYELQFLPNNGLCLTYDRHEIRILKADDGGLPVPGPSKSRQAFWKWNGQQSFNFSYDDDPPAENEQELPSLHLVVLWDVNSLYTLNRLLLGCPTSGETTKESVSAYFLEEIPHPVETIDAASMSGQDPTLDDLDLDLKLKERVDDQR